MSSVTIMNTQQGLARRYYFGAAIDDFLSMSDMEIIGKLVMASPHDSNEETTMSWAEEITVVKNALKSYSGRGSVFMEYNIPRLGRRADVIALIDNIVIVMEFKAMNNVLTHAAYLQVWDYALDLKNFQLGSRDRVIVPIVVATKAANNNCSFELVHHEDDVYQPLLSNGDRLGECIKHVLDELKHGKGYDPKKDEAWAKSGYEPTPTIVEAATALFNHHTVDDITRHDADDLNIATKTIDQIINNSKRLQQKAICFVTGVPGAGKTLIGLQTAIRHFDPDHHDGAIYLSGNYPLVNVLQEALARDYVQRDRERVAQEIAEGKPGQKAVTKKDAQSKVKAFIQMIHHYRDTYLEGIRINNDNGGLEPIPGYFTSHQDKAYIPSEHVAIFDEAQRAWTRDVLARFLADKTKGRTNVLNDFPYSEPEFLISTINRHEDWGVVICLIGGGQEINKGEAGIGEWVKAINRRYQDWNVYISDQLMSEEYEHGRIVDIIDKSHLYIVPGLHLAVSMRQFRAGKVADFVHHLLALEPEKASQILLKELTQYPIALTRSLDKAKQWLRKHQKGTQRMGMLASSKAERLKAISINVRYKPNFVEWFLAGDDDIRSSNHLEDTLTEFEVQGLEIDWACVVWDADMILSSDHTKWEHRELRSGTKWNNINDSVRQRYQLNAYRVLLTRARLGMIIVVPEGDPNDSTRKPEWYDGIYNYLKQIGLSVI